MKIQKTFSLYFASAALITTLFVGATLLFMIDANWYVALFQKRIFMIPMGIFILLTSVLFGIVTGWIIGMVIHQKSEEISASLLEIEQGNYELNVLGVKQKDDFLSIWHRIDGISQRLQDQAKVHQKLASERVESNSQLKEEVLTKERNRLGQRTA